MICRECGNEIEDDVEFCYFCGADYSDNKIADSIEKEINCPICGGKLEKGKIEVINARSLFNIDTFVRYYPKQNDGKIIKKNASSLQLKADGLFCARCNKYIGIFEPR